jgi:hypothetical protein
MTSITENKSKKNQILLITLASLLGGLLLHIFTGVNGVGMSPDSANYIAAARSLIAGKGFLDITGKTFVAWPPLLPVIIAWFKICGIDYPAILRLINILSFIIIIFSSSLLVLKNTESLTLSLLNASMVIFSKPLFFVSTHGWSEPLFIAEICLFMLILSYCKDTMDYKIILLGIVTIAFNLTRYPGVTLSMIGCLYIFFKFKGTYLSRIIKAGVWGFITVLPLALWFARNYILIKSITAERLESTLTLAHNLQLTGKLISLWFLPLSLSQIMSGWVVFTLLIILLLSLIIFIIYKFLVRKINPFDYPVTAPVLFIFFYGFMLISSVTKVVLSPLSDRYLSALFVPLLFIFLYFLYLALNDVVSSGKNLKNTSAKLTIISILSIFAGGWLSSEINIVAAQAYNAYYNGYDGYNEKSYQQSVLYNWLKANKLEGKFYSNSLCSLFIWTYYESELSPYKYLADGGTPEVSRKKSEETVAAFIDSLEKNEKVYLIWHLPNTRKNLYDINELQQFCNMKLIQKFSDGFIYELYSLSGNQLNK